MEPAGSIPTVTPDRKSPKFDSDLPPQDVSHRQYPSKRRVQQTVSYQDESVCEYKSGGLKSGYRNSSSGSVRYVGKESNNWLSTPYSPNNGYSLGLTRNGLYLHSYCNRSYGYSVRPVLAE